MKIVIKNKSVEIPVTSSLYKDIKHVISSYGLIMHKMHSSPEMKSFHEKMGEVFAGREKWHSDQMAKTSNSTIRNYHEKEKNYCCNMKNHHCQMLKAFKKNLP